jgi:glyoxylase-like metal-dependent hydrolase (beta-lactamase superfamily II)
MSIETAKPSELPAVVRQRFGPVEVVFGDRGGKYPNANFAIVHGTDSRAIIDLPLVSRRLPEELELADFVLLTHIHEDHTPGLRLVPDTPVQVHRDDLAAIRSIRGFAAHLGFSAKANAATCELARTKFYFRPRRNAGGFEDGAVWDLGRARIRAIHAPGHTAGHCVFLVEPDNIAFLGDVDLSTFGPYYGDASSSLPAFRSTIARLRELPAVCWVTSHHKGVLTDRDAFLAALRIFGAALERREAALLEALREGPKTLEDLVRKRFVYPPTYLEVYVNDVERRMISQHLDQFVEEGRVVCEGTRYRRLAR